MLRAHSFLWHYLWLAPHVLQVGLAILLWRRGLHRIFPIFFIYTSFEAVEEFTLYGLDVLPQIEAETFWRAFWVGLILEGLLKVALTGELFLHLLRPWPALAKTGNRLITGAGAILVLAAGMAAGFTVPANPYWLISGAHVLEQAMYIIGSGLIAFVFLFVAYFRLTWDRSTFGIALGLAIISCEHLAAWAVIASGGLADQSYLLDFLNMATYHVCVLIWSYYLLFPQKSATKSVVPLPENNLAIWNRELERLLQQ